MKIAPLNALYFNSTKVDLDDVVTPPYDVISPEDEKRFCLKSPYNFAHIIMPREEDEPYTEAVRRLGHWLKDQVLSRSEGPHYYVYEQKFERNGKKHQRTTFLCAVRLQDFSEGSVRPHEKTHGSAQSDRLQILKKTGCNLSSIFAVAQDPEGIMAENFEKWEFHPALLKATTDDGIEHAVWEIDPNEAKNVVRFLEEHPLYIVDGHHRYSSALDYAKELQTEGTDDPSAFMFFAVANSFDPALLVYPTHRIVHQVGHKDLANPKSLDEFLSLRPFEYENVEGFVSNSNNQPNFLIDFGDKIYLAEPRHPDKTPVDPIAAVNKLSVAWSDRFLLSDKLGIGEQDRSASISYCHDWKQTLDTQGALLKIILPAMSVADIIQVSDEQGYMPQKSTYFYPKLAAGMVLRQVNPAALE